MLPYEISFPTYNRDVLLLYTVKFQNVCVTVHNIFINGVCVAFEYFFVRNCMFREDDIVILKLL